MNLLYNQRLLFSSLFFIILFVVTWPLYQYVSDLDAIGYMEVAHHYIDGELKLAVNGFWNPLHSWLVIPFIKAGLNDWAAFKVSNLVFSIGSLIALHELLNKFPLELWLKAAIQYASVIVLLSYCHFELAADALLVFQLLVYFNLIKEEDFFTSIPKNLLAGTIGATLYLAKSYGFPFFIFHFLVIHLFLNPNKRNAVKQLAAGYFMFFLFTFPWLAALHWKYGEWMIAFGKFNAHWNFADGPPPGPVIHPPPHEGSSSVWEDPWHVRVDNISSAPFITVALHQLRVILFNFQQWLKCIHDLSFLSPAILLLSGFMYFKEKNRVWLYMVIGMLVLPSGYILLHLETRFIWATSFIFFIAGAWMLQLLFQKFTLRNWQRVVIWLLFFGSFVLEPINTLKDKIYDHKEIFDTADNMKAKGIEGRFTSNAKADFCQVIAYRTGSPYYTIVKPIYPMQELLGELQQYRVNYYFFYYHAMQEKEEFLKGSIAARAVKFIDLQPGLLVVQLNEQQFAEPEKNTR